MTHGINAKATSRFLKIRMKKILSFGSLGIVDSI